MQFKRDSEIERLAKRLDSLKSEQHRAASEAGAAQAQAIAEVQAQLDAAERAEYVGRQQAHEAEQAALRGDYDETLKGVVEVTTEFRDLLGALDERRKQLAELGIYPAQDFCSGLQAAVKGAFWAWDKNTSLTGAPPKPSREREAVDNSEAQLRSNEALLSRYRGMVADFKGDRQGQMFRQLVAILQGHANATRAARSNLAACLAQLDAKGQATTADRLRRVELMEADTSETVTISF